MRRRRVSWFCSLKGNEFFAEVEHDFMQDDFNLTGLSAQVPYYEYALDTILDAESAASARFSKDQQEAIESAAELLYGLIHARYIITPRGMAAMLEKVRSTDGRRVRWRLPLRPTPTTAYSASLCVLIPSSARAFSHPLARAVQDGALWAVPARPLPGAARAARRPV